jgi:hypothetical protein
VTFFYDIQRGQLEMDGRVDVVPLSKFHCNRTQQQEIDGKRIFL